MDIKTVIGNCYEETVTLIRQLNALTEECIASIAARTDAGDLTKLKARLNEIRLLTEKVLLEGGGYAETLMKRQSVLDAYSRLTIK